MIQSTDNLEATNYSHQCGVDIFLKLPNLKDKNSIEDKSSNLKSPVNKPVDRSTVKLNDKLKDKLNNKTNDSLNDKLSDKSNDNLVDKLNEKSIDKLNDNLIDKSNKSTIVDKLPNQRTNGNLISNLKKKDNNQKKKDNFKKESSKKESSKKDNISINQHHPNNRKRSDIENIFDFNTLIKRVKAEMPKPPRPLVFCGPSGSGKSSLLQKLRADYPEYFGFSISHTTREPRVGETHGKHYYYVSREEMLKAIENDEFIEHVEFSNNIYGTSKKAVEDVRSLGKICILDIEIEGVKNLKKSDLNPVYIFIKTPTINELETRLRKRGSETEANIRMRLTRAQDEMNFGEEEHNFDLLLVNDDFDSTYRDLKRFVFENYGLTDTKAEEEDEEEKPETNAS